MPVLTRSRVSAEQDYAAAVPPRSQASDLVLKEKMRALTLLYEQHKQLHQKQQLRSSGPKGIGPHHPSVDLLSCANDDRGKAVDNEPGAQNGSKTHVVYSRVEEKENYSCPVKRNPPVALNAAASAAGRKLSLGTAGLKTTAVSDEADKEAGSRILVFVRLRPMSRKERDAGSRCCVKIVNKRDVYLTELASENDYLRLKRVRGRHFCFDSSFPDSTSQQEVYSTTTADLVESVLQGRNGTVFCYGATGAGKTYTMLGTTDSPGVMVLAIKDLFSKIRQRSHDGSHSVQLSYLEIYNETVKDLLSPGRPLLLREDKQGIVAAGLTHYRAYSTDEVMKLLQQGNQNRTTEPTRANETSSRSHAILQVVAEYKAKDSGMTRVGKLSLIDLAGSERALATDQRSERSLEGANINRSLLALSSCINALVEGKKHIPYRNSKLTQLLKDSLGGTCNTVMIANISPAHLSFGETQNTLHWADRAKEIKTKAISTVEETVKIPESETDQAKLLLDLQKENGELRHQLVKMQQKLMAVQAQSLATNSMTPTVTVPSPQKSPQPSTQRKAKRSILRGNCFNTPELKRKPNEGEQQVQDLQRKMKSMEAEMEKMKREYLLQLKQKDNFIRELIRKKAEPLAAGQEPQRRVITRVSLRKQVRDTAVAAEAATGEPKSPSHRFVSPVATAKKRSIWDITNGNSPSVLMPHRRKTRSLAPTSEITKVAAPSMLLQPGFARQRFDLPKR